MSANPTKTGNISNFFYIRQPKYYSGVANINVEEYEHCSMPVPNLKVISPLGWPISYLNPMVPNFQVANPIVHVVTPRAKKTSQIPEPSMPFDQLSVEHLASWVESLAISKSWEEAEQYVSSFRQKKIDGKRLIKMSTEDLWVHVNINKLGHRLTIVNAVKKLLHLPYARWADVIGRWQKSCDNFGSPSSVFSLDIPEIFSSERRSQSVPARHSPNGKKWRCNFQNCFREIGCYSEGDCEEESAKFSPIPMEGISLKARRSSQKPFKNGRGTLTEKEVFHVNVQDLAAHSFSEVVRTAKCGIGAANFVTGKDKNSNIDL